MALPNHQQIEELVVHYAPALRVFVRLRMGALLRSREESCDIVQSVAREVLQHSDRFQHGEEKEFRDWLFTTAQRKIVNHLEHWHAEKRDVQREQPVSVERELAALTQTPSKHASARECLTAVERAFDQLPEEQREIVIMSRLMGHSHAEIAARVGKTEVAVRKALSRGLALLAATLAADDELEA